jgi:regulator of sigma E protease
MNAISNLRLRSAGSLALACGAGVKDAFEHPFGQLLFYSWLVMVLPHAYWPVMAAIVFAVMIHEVGHWVVARICGYPIDTFSIGIPAGRVLELGRLGGTMIQITPYWFLGGYVTFEPTAESAMSTPVWKRACVLLAGIAFNLLGAVGLYSASAYIVGQEVFRDVPVLSRVTEAGYAGKAGMLSGDTVLAVNGNATDSARQVIVAIGQRTSEDVRFDVLRAGRSLEIAAHAPLNQRLGIEVGFVERQPIDVASAAAKGSASVWKMLSMTGQLIWKSVVGSGEAGSVSGKSASQVGFEVHGVVGFMQFAAGSFSKGWASFLAIVAAFNINLAILNLLPIPVLDGGHVFFLVIEKLRGRPVAVETQMKIMKVCMWGLLALALFGLYNDLAHPLSGTP